MALSCEICGSINLVKQDGRFVCQNCGMQYSLEEIRKIYNGIDSTQAKEIVLESPTHANRLKNAMSEYRSGNYERAISLFSDLLNFDPTNVEALYYKALSNGKLSTPEKQLIKTECIQVEEAIAYAVEQKMAHEKLTAFVSEATKEVLSDAESVIRPILLKMATIRREYEQLKRDNDRLNNRVLTSLTNFSIYDPDDTDRLISAERNSSNQLLVKIQEMGDAEKPYIEIIESLIDFGNEVYEKLPNRVKASEEYSDTLDEILKAVYAEEVDKHCGDRIKAKRDKLEQKKKKLIEIGSRIRTELYWEAHQKERSALEAEKEEAEKSIQSINEEITQFRRMIADLRATETKVRNQTENITKKRNHYLAILNQMETALESQIYNSFLQAVEQLEKFDNGELLENIFTKEYKEMEKAIDAEINENEKKSETTNTKILELKLVKEKLSADRQNIDIKIEAIERKTQEIKSSHAVNELTTIEDHLIREALINSSEKFLQPKELTNELASLQEKEHSYQAQNQSLQKSIETKETEIKQNEEKIIELETQAYKNSQRKYLTTKSMGLLIATERKLRSLQLAYGGLGIFKAKEKKELKEKIDSLNREIIKLQSDAENERKALLSSIETEGKKIADTIRLSKEIIKQCESEKKIAEVDVRLNMHAMEETRQQIITIEELIYTTYKEYLCDILVKHANGLREKGNLVDAQKDENEKKLKDTRETLEKSEEKLAKYREKKKEEKIATIKTMKNQILGIVSTRLDALNDGLSSAQSETTMLNDKIRNLNKEINSREESVLACENIIKRIDTELTTER